MPPVLPLATLCGLLCLAPMLVAAAPSHVARCSLPQSIDGRRFTNTTDPHYRPDNPNAGRTVRVDFGAGRYLLSVLGTRTRHPGRFSYRRLAPTIGVIDMQEDYEGGESHYQLVLTCLDDHQGLFVFTQFAGPMAPARRQNGGRWTLQPR